jgi:polysaccharide export outer membrane protein
MNNIFNRIRKFQIYKGLSITYIGLILLIFSSCLSQRKVEYLQIKGHADAEYTNSPFQEYKIKPYDELYIQISSLDDAQSSISSNSASGGQGLGSNGVSQKVDKNGFLELPVVGKILVKDKNVEQVTAMLKESFKNVLNMPLVSVRLANSHITILGEVKSPGHFMYMEDKLSIFDAIGMAGDITDFGNRKTIVLLRNIDGKAIRTELDLTKPDIITSEFYYVKPYDLIYVKPLRLKFLGFREFPYTTIFTTIATFFIVLTYIK